jgi:hypothetical protein
MDNEPVILLLYVDDLFLTREEKLTLMKKQHLRNLEDASLKKCMKRNL